MAENAMLGIVRSSEMVGNELRNAAALLGVARSWLAGVLMISEIANYEQRMDGYK